MPYEAVIRSVVDNWYGDMMWGDRSNDMTWIDKMVRELSAAVEANGGENTRADTAELLFEGLEKDYQKVVAAFDEQRTLALNLRKSLIGYMAAVETMNAAMRDGVNVHGAISDLTAWGDLATAVIAESEDLS